MGKPVMHYRKPGDGGTPACGKGNWVPPSRLSTDPLAVTCRDCQHSNAYREASAVAVLSPEFLPGRGPVT